MVCRTFVLDLIVARKSGFGNRQIVRTFVFIFGGFGERGGVWDGRTGRGRPQGAPYGSGRLLAAGRTVRGRRGGRAGGWEALPAKKRSPPEGGQRGPVIRRTWGRRGSGRRYRAGERRWFCLPFPGAAPAAMLPRRRRRRRSRPERPHFSQQGGRW